MLKKRKIKMFLLSCLIITFTIMPFSANLVMGQGDPFIEIQEKLEDISIAEKEIIQNLFVLVQEIEEMKRAEVEIEQELKAINQEVKALEGTIIDEKRVYENKQDVLRQVLRSYQRRGPGSYLEIILKADSLTAFLRRINTFRDLTRNTGELLSVMEKSREKLSIEKIKLAEKLVLIEGKQEQLREALTKKQQLIKTQEEYITSLAGERAYYQEYLKSLERLLDELETLFSEIAGEFSRTLAAGNLPPNAVKTTITFNGIKGSIEEKTFNDIIKGNPRLPEMVFRFHSGKIEMNLPQKKLLLAGKFVILEGNHLKFEVQEGSFYGMPLALSAIEEFLREGHLLFDLKPLVGKNVVDSIEILDGHLELRIIPSLF